MKIKAIYDDTLKFDNGMALSSYHCQECCETHYADFDVLCGYNINPKTGQDIDIRDIEFNEDIENYIQLVDGMGFNLIAKDGSKYFVPCYATNNGYYNSRLTLEILNMDHIMKEIGISKCQQWEY